MFYFESDNTSEQARWSVSSSALIGFHITVRVFVTVTNTSSIQVKLLEFTSVLTGVLHAEVMF